MGRPTKYEQARKRVMANFGFDENATDAEIYKKINSACYVELCYRTEGQDNSAKDFNKEYRKIMANEQVLIEGVTETVVEPIVKTVSKQTVRVTTNGNDNLDRVALNKFIVHLEDASGNSLGSILHETELDNEGVRAWFEGKEPLELVLNNQFTSGIEMSLDGFSKPLRVVNLEKI